MQHDARVIVEPPVFADELVENTRSRVALNARDVTARVHVAARCANRFPMSSRLPTGTHARAATERCGELWAMDRTRCVFSTRSFNTSTIALHAAARSAARVRRTNRELPRRHVARSVRESSSSERLARAPTPRSRCRLRKPQRSVRSAHTPLSHQCRITVAEGPETPKTSARHRHCALPRQGTRTRTGACSTTAYAIGRCAPLVEQQFAARLDDGAFGSLPTAGRVTPHSSRRTLCHADALGLVLPVIIDIRRTRGSTQLCAMVFSSGGAHPRWTHASHRRCRSRQLSARQSPIRVRAVPLAGCRFPPRRRGYLELTEDRCDNRPATAARSQCTMPHRLPSDVGTDSGTRHLSFPIAA